YSFQYPMTYRLVSKDGATVQTLSGQAIAIPAGFEGTLILDLNKLGAGDLSIIGENGTSVGFQNQTISNMSFYFNGEPGDILLINSDIITFDYQGVKTVHSNALRHTTPTSNMGDARLNPPMAITENNLSVLVNGQANSDEMVFVN